MFSGDTTMLYDYLDGILNTVQFKDAAVRLGISNIAALETATRYLFDSVENLVNPKSIADVMTSMGTENIVTYDIQLFEGACSCVHPLSGAAL